MEVTAPTRHDGITLAALVDALGPSVVRLVERDGSDEALVRESVLWDPVEPLIGSRGGVLLLVGGEPASPACAAAIDDASRAGYVAVALKRRGQDLDQVARVASRSSIALLVVGEDVAWGTLDSLLASAIASHHSDSPSTFEATSTGDLFAIANAIARNVGAAITIEDAGWHVLAYSSITEHPIDAVRQDSILGRRVRRLDAYESEYRAIARSSEPVFFAPYDDVLARVAMPVRASGRLLGSIWAIDVDNRRGADIGAVLEEVMPSVALHLLSAAHRGDLARYRRAELLSVPLGVRAPHGVDVSESLRRLLPAALFGFGPLDRAEAIVDDLRLTDVVAASAEALRHDSSCARVANAIYVLLPGERNATTPLRRFAEATVEALVATSGLAFGGAYVEDVVSFDSIALARGDIDLALRGMERAGRFAVLSVDEHRHVTVLQEMFEHGVADERHLVAPLRALLEHDRTTGSAYAATLLAHLDHAGDVRAAAAALFVHENSHRYRMRRIVEQFGVDLDDPQQRLVLWLQLRARATD